MDVAETYRVERLIHNYAGIKISPFGIIAPFYWKNHPECKIFYQPFKDVIRIYEKDQFVDFDVYDWSFEMESDWLTKTQKDNIKKCLSIISYNIDEYLNVSAIEKNFELIK